MKILIFTNTYLPHVGGVARSVDAFTHEYRRAGHDVLIVAPEFQGMPDAEAGVIRVPAIQNFNGSDFSVRLPIPGYLETALRDFNPDLVHSHHPFLLGDTALRAAAEYNVPLVFQHHTMYERYTHYVPGDSPALKQFAVDLSREYANLCDYVFAPSESVAAVLRDRRVQSPIEVVPTGVDVARFAHGEGRRLRRELGIGEETFIVGHVGRLAEEKNVPFLAKAVSRFLRGHADACFLVIGEGPSQEEIPRIFARSGLEGRLHLAGTLRGQDLVDAYHAMDVFAFASRSETQGMVLTEAMAAGCPVVALDAPGVREVVDDRKNGRLLPTNRIESFATSLAWVAEREPSAYDDLCRAAQATARRFAMSTCAQKALGIYESLVESRAGGKLGKTDWESSWQPILRRAEVEWNLLSTRAQAAGRAVFGFRSFWHGFARLRQRIRKLSSRSQWLAHLFRFSTSPSDGAEPGLILIQLDGLSRPQFERALAQGRLPSMRRMLRKEHYLVHDLYSGLPSTTPAVQGELFYGVSGAVPAFYYRDHETGEPARAYEPATAAKIQQRLSRKGQGLLDGGSAFSDTFSGGAAESHYCPATADWDEAARKLNPIALAATVVLHFWSAVRVVAALALELVLALVDFARGTIAGRDLAKELKFVPTRLGISVLLRELATGGACVDAARGLPVIHLNFLGYDEQAHRRGPGSAFAHWSLKGIDDAIRRIWSVARHSEHRDYQIWVYSDHGQERVIPYAELTGNSIHDAVASILSANVPEPKERASRAEGGIQNRRIGWLNGRGWRWLFREYAEVEEPNTAGPLTAAMGPIGHIYPREPLSAEQRDRVARRLVHEAKVPLVLAAEAESITWAWNSRGKFRIPEEALEVLGASHPWLETAAEDLSRLCHHPDAGELVISGWRPDALPISFAQEQGAHGGPGTEETHAFLLLPSNIALESEGNKVARPLDLRHAALTALGRRIRKAADRPSFVRRKTLRVVTYNVHSCVGTDGKLSPARIARVIAQCEPDVVALQELDVGRSRTGHVDQALAIATHLRMEHHFHPTVEAESEQYGNAVLSRFPMSLVRAARLPCPAGRQRLEPRGAMWVTLDVDGQPWQLLNVHLGLSPRERHLQTEALLGDEWCGDPRFGNTSLVCGDFNAAPGSGPYRLLCSRLDDARRRRATPRRLPTFPSRLALRRLDHVFVSSNVEVVDARVGSSELARVASDHLPLVAEIRIIPAKSADHMMTRLKE